MPPAMPYALRHRVAFDRPRTAPDEPHMTPWVWTTGVGLVGSFGVLAAGAEYSSAEMTLIIGAVVTGTVTIIGAVVTGVIKILSVLRTGIKDAKDTAVKVARSATNDTANAVTEAINDSPIPTTDEQYAAAAQKMVGLMAPSLGPLVARMVADELAKREQAAERLKVMT